MMTGAILGGSSVEQAARLQMVIMFMISSCTALSSIVTTIFALSIIVDNEHRVRTDRIDGRPHVVYRSRDAAWGATVRWVKSRWQRAWGAMRGKAEARGDEDRERLLG